MFEQTTLTLPKVLPSGPLVFDNELPFRAFLERLPAGAYTCDAVDPDVLTRLLQTL